MKNIFLLLILFFISSCFKAQDLTVIYVMRGPHDNCYKNYPKKINSCSDTKLYNRLILTIIPENNIVNYLISPYKLSKNNIVFGTLNNCSIVDQLNFRCDELTVAKGEAIENKIIPNIKINKANFAERIKFWIDELGLSEHKYPDIEILGRTSFSDNQPEENDFSKKNQSTSVLFRKKDSVKTGGLVYGIFYRTNLKSIKYYVRSTASGPTVFGGLEDLNKDDYAISEDKSSITIAKEKNHDQGSPVYSISGGWGSLHEDPAGPFKIDLIAKNSNDDSYYTLANFNYYIHDCDSPHPGEEIKSGFSELFKGGTFEEKEQQFCNKP